MLTAYAFIFITLIACVLALIRGPIWALLLYIGLYFYSPRPDLYWWASYLPQIKWTFISSLVLIVSIVLHRRSLATTKFHSIKWLVGFFLLTFFISLKGTVVPDVAREYTYRLFTYCFVAICIIKVLKDKDQFRLLLLSIIFMAANLSLNAYLYGIRINGRLEGIGSVDAYGSNEFSLLLAGIIPLTLPFIFCGKLYERVLCIVSLPFLLNAYILCNSRGAFVAFIVAVFLASVFFFDRRTRKVILISVICIIPLFTYLSDDAFIERVSSLLNIREALSDEAEIERLSSGRSAIWGYGIDMVKDYPLGAGPNGFKHLARFYMPEDILTFHAGSKYGVRAAHNTYLQVLVEQGVLGIMIFLFLCIHTMLLLFKSYYKLKRLNVQDDFWKYIIFPLTISLFVSLLGGLFTSRVYYEFFWWQIAFSVVVFSIVDRMEHVISEKSDKSMSGSDVNCNNENIAR